MADITEKINFNKKVIVKKIEELKERENKINIISETVLSTLIEKNRRYGSSASNPLNIFASHVTAEKKSSINMILIRLDDKLKRVQTSSELRVNDLFDIIGYITLLMVELDITKEQLEALLD